MKPIKTIKLFLLLSIFLMYPVNAMENKTISADFSSLVKENLEKKRLELEDKKLLENLDINILDIDTPVSAYNVIIKIHDPNNIPKAIDMALIHKKHKYREATCQSTLLYWISANCNDDYKLSYLINNCKNGKKTINEKDKNGDTPLHGAYKYSLYGNFLVLLEYRADSTITNNDGQTCTEIKQFVLGSYGKSIKSLAPDRRYVPALHYYKVWHIKNETEQNKKLVIFFGNKDNKERQIYRYIANRFGHQNTLKLLKNITNVVREIIIPVIKLNNIIIEKSEN